MNSLPLLTNAAIRLVTIDISQSREPSVDFVQGAFFERLTDFDLSLELKLEQKIPVNCLLEVRDVFAVMPTGCGKSFFLAVTAKKNS